MIYNYIEQQGNRIIHCFTDDNGRKKTEIVKNFPIQLYIPVSEEKADTVGIYGTPLASMDFDCMADAREFAKTHDGAIDIHGQTNYIYQYIYNTYPNEIQFTIKDFDVIHFDIETQFTDEFPDPSKAKQPILSISCVIHNENKVKVFGMKDYTGNKSEILYEKCNSEEELLEKFARYIRTFHAPILSGWNVAGFDIPYLVNRMEKVFGEGGANKLSPFEKKLKNCIKLVPETETQRETYEILGVTIHDYLDLYKSYTYHSLESYTLNHVADVELGEEKVDYGEYADLMDLYRNNFNLFIEYNAHDSVLVKRFEDKLNFIYLSITIAYLAKIKLSDIGSQVKFWDNMICNFLKKDGIQIPPRQSNEKIRIEGAFVKDPVPGKYQWITSFDLTSLYPSIIMTFNASPETLTQEATGNHIEDIIHGKIDLSDLKDSNECMMANGARFSREKQGMLPRIIEHVFGMRKAKKKEMLRISSELEKMDKNDPEYEKMNNKKVSLDAEQLALKVALNSAYGASANNYFRYFNRNIAEGITLTGQLSTKYIEHTLDIYLNKLFKTNDESYTRYIDTDSVFLDLSRFIDAVVKGEGIDKQKIVDVVDKFCVDRIEPEIARNYEVLSDTMNVFQNKFHMKREKIIDRAFWRAKKQYILQVYDNEGVRYREPKIVATGVELARSTTTKFVKGGLKKVINALLNGDEQDLQRVVADFRKEFFTAPLDEIAAPMGVHDIGKWIDDATGRWKKGAPIHVKASISYNNMLIQKGLSKKFPKIKNNDKIRFVCLTKANPTMNNAIAFFDTIHPEFEMDQYVDREQQFQKVFLTPVESFTRYLHWTPNKQQTIEALFGEGNEISAPKTDVMTKRNEAQQKKKNSTKKSSSVSSIDAFF